MQKKYLITGATSGIGLATCKKILSNGDIVYAVGRNNSKLSDFSSEYDENFFHFLLFDLSKISLIESIFNDLIVDGIKFDGFVHCAGIEETMPLTLYTPEKIFNIFEINVFAAIELIRVFSKKKYSNDGASIIFFSSVMGVLGQQGKVGYCSSKSAILGLTKSSALELAKRKIRVNAVLPGVVNTPMTQKLFSQIEQKNIDSIKAMHPLGIGEVEDIVPAIEFLLSDGSRWLTGQNIIIDGGYSIQ
jgi:NAD(P)-dependent dehydrogenase (short-subunit alcohol dehydrogenase family)